MAPGLPAPILRCRCRSGLGLGGRSTSVGHGFRALISRNGDYQVRSRRGWRMTSLLPELADLPGTRFGR